MEIGTLIVVGVLLLLALAIGSSIVKVVPQGREFTVEKFGRYTRTLRPGLHLLTPFIEGVGYKMNMRERVLDIPNQDVITKDNAMVSVDAVVFIQVIDAPAAAYEVDNLDFAIVNL